MFRSQAIYKCLIAYIVYFVFNVNEYLNFKGKA